LEPELSVKCPPQDVVQLAVTLIIVVVVVVVAEKQDNAGYKGHGCDGATQTHSRGTSFRQ